MDQCATPGLMDLDKALNKLLNATIAITEKKQIALSESLGYVLATNVTSPVNVPAFDNSAMDGFAYCNQSDNTSFTVVGTAYAGAPFQGQPSQGECVRIMTGAAIPAGCDTVVMQEQTQIDNTIMMLTAQQPTGNNIRLAGDDIKAGETVLRSGTRLSARHIPLLASLGIATVSVFRRPVVAIISTGDELKPLGQPLEYGEIYDTNRYTLTSLLQRSQCEILDLGIIKDDKSSIRDAFVKASASADLVITSGGVSVGDADYTREVLEEIGEIGFWKLAIKPGKPFAFGKINDTLFCGLPGNPVSALVTFMQLVYPLLQTLASQEATPALKLAATTNSAFKKRPGRVDFQRGIYHVKDGELTVETTGNQSSGAFSSLAAANCFVVLERERGNVGAGEKVIIEPFDWLLA
ncbi:molybdopterin molybdotransferase MoeA [Thaumasiovibrio sp. DFM-14]|uniref:molybdopterin molybdotransferase MoeA n=1 Tax=Thaumasiovibrio sp. DFM-14 TaxID=3384792 RepID=UPI0039A0F4C6